MDSKDSLDDLFGPDDLNFILLSLVPEFLFELLLALALIYLIYRTMLYMLPIYMYLRKCKSRNERKRKRSGSDDYPWGNPGPQEKKKN